VSALTDPGARAGPVVAARPWVADALLTRHAREPWSPTAARTATRTATDEW